MEKPLGFSDAVASGSIKRISSFFIYMGFKSVDWIKVIKNKLIFNFILSPLQVIVKNVKLIIILI